MRHLIHFIIVLGLLMSALPASAQVVVTQYRLTRTFPAPVMSAVIQKSSMACNLPRGVPSGIGFRIENESNPAMDCEALGTFGVIVPNPTNAAHVYTIAAAQADGLWGPEGGMASVIPPPAPTGGRVRPGASAQVSAEGVVGQRFAFSGNEVVPVVLDTYGIPVYFGALALTVPGVYDVRPGDRFAFTFWR